MKNIKIGLDIHGVIDTYPKTFAYFSKAMRKIGNEIYIITGEPEKSARDVVEKAGVVFDHFYSIVDYHIEKQTPSLRQDDRGHYWVDRQEWLATKGVIAEEVGLNVHFDDQIEYFEYFPKECTLIYVPKENFDLVVDNMFIF